MENYFLAETGLSPYQGTYNIFSIGFQNCYGPVTHLYHHGVPVVNGVSPAVILCPSRRCVSGQSVAQTNNFSVQLCRVADRGLPSAPAPGEGGLLDFEPTALWAESPGNCGRMTVF